MLKSPFAFIFRISYVDCKNTSVKNLCSLEHFSQFVRCRIIRLKETYGKIEKSLYIWVEMRKIDDYNKGGSKTADLRVRAAAVDLESQHNGKTERFSDSLPVHGICRYKSSDVWPALKCPSWRLWDDWENEFTDRTDRYSAPHACIASRPFTVVFGLNQFGKALTGEV